LKSEAVSSRLSALSASTLKADSGKTESRSYTDRFRRA
jgi:hypothetical protein